MAVRWLNQYAYDTTWNGRRVRVYIKRLRPIVVSDNLIKSCSVDLESFIKRLVVRT